MLIPAVGPKDAKIMFVGEAPGEDEVRKGEPFVGRSGQLLTQKMHEAGILRQLCYITNVVKERPHRNNIEPFINLRKKHVITSLAYDKYEEVLKLEIETVKPNIVVAVGEVALYALTRKRGITKWRGSVLESTLVPGQKVLPIRHPAAALREYMLQHYIARDLLRVLAESKSPEISYKEREFILEPSYKDTMEFIAECATKKRVAFDIEVSGLELSCISLAYTDDLAISIPFIKEWKHYYNRPQECEVLKGIAHILEDPDIESLGQNTTFDTSFLFRKYGIKTRNIHDTMVASKILYPEFEKSLAFLTSIYTDVPYYKDEGKEKFTRGVDAKTSDLDFWLYNAKDSIVLMEIFPRQLRELQAQGNLETYIHQVALIEPLLYLSERGLRMKQSAMKEASLDFEAELIALQNDLNDITGDTFTQNHHKKLKEWFYGTKKAKVYVNKKGNPSTDEGALKRLVRQDDPDVSKAASILLDMRKKGKIKGTYYDMKLDEENGEMRLRCSMNPVGSKFGRLSSSQTIWKTGANLQNQPPEMKKYMLPDVGYEGYNLDLSQAENRIVAQYGPDERMMNAFSTGIDVHALTASFISGKTIEEIIYDEGMFEQTKDKKYASPIGSGRYTWRFWGKKANHAFNYDFGYKSFAYLYEIPERDGKMIWEMYRKAYAGVPKYHRRIQEQLKKDRILTNLYGRKIMFLDRWGDALFKEAYSAIPQSTVADKINREGVKFLYYRQDLFPEVELLTQIHDSIGIQIPLSAGWERHAEILLLLKANLETPLTCHGREFVIPVDIKQHPKNFGKGHEFKGGHKWDKECWDIDVFARELEFAHKEAKYAA